MRIRYPDPFRLVLGFAARRYAVLNAVPARQPRSRAAARPGRRGRRARRAETRSAFLRALCVCGTVSAYGIIYHRVPTQSQTEQPARATEHAASTVRFPYSG